ncbi:hypothetical protein Pcinc_015062 [Petrolisthes cinctipes]|uniref:Uncharacterized protein n=1 Tax=Petrolisthes cinctipes TaxID=88211 RepID=A0AAE1FVP8_PETCI|nr:hypothetical protein Pcinc_015062 [Petrolisthes cinctipes]
MVVVIQKTMVMVIVLLILDLPHYSLADNTGDEKLSKEELLRNKLLDKYDRMSLPQRNHNGTTTVVFDILTNGITISEDTQIVNLNAWVKMVWVDPRLVWDVKDYGNLVELHFGPDEIWQPDMCLYNNADATNNDYYGKINLLVDNNGTVIWVPPSTLRAECPLDLTYWPYDIQTCYFFLGSWTRHGTHIDIRLPRNATIKKVYPGWFIKYSHMWQYIDGYLRRSEHRYSFSAHPYVMLQLKLSFLRTSPIFASTIVIPAVVLSLLTLLQFVLPLREPLRVVVGCVTLILTFLVLIYLASVLPPLSGSVPIIVKFFGQTLGVVLVSVGVNAVLLKLTDSRHPSPTSTPPPAMLKTLLTGPLAKILFLTQYIDKVGQSGGGDEDGEVLNSTCAPPSYLHEWLLVAAAVDRVAFIIFLATFVITLIAHVAPV